MVVGVAGGFVVGVGLGLTAFVAYLIYDGMKQLEEDYVRLGLAYRQPIP